MQLTALASWCALAAVAAPELVRSPEGIQRFLEAQASAPFFALDTETSGLDPHLDRLLLIQFGTAEAQCLIDAQSVTAEALRPIFHPDRPVVMHNASFDLKMLKKRYGRALGLHEADIIDSLQNEKLLRNGRKFMRVGQGFALKVLAERYAGMELDKSVREGFYGATSVESLSEAELHYAARDVEATWKVLAEQLLELKRDDLLRVSAIEGAACLAFAELELQGMPIETACWSQGIEAAQEGRASARGKLDEAFQTVADRDLFGGTTLNYDADEEVLEALGKLGVRVPTLRRETLLATGHPAAIEIARYREQRRIVETYGDTFLSYVHTETGRIHPRFRAIGASTGRSSCSEPNLQGIPKGSSFRDCFLPGPGRQILTADYAGAELCIIAELSEDAVFVESLVEGADLHAQVASRLFGQKVSKTEHPELRARAKAVNFGLIYGMGARGLARQLGVDETEAEALLKSYFASFPRVQSYLEDAAKKSLRRGFAETLAGRKLWFFDAKRDNKDPASLERVAKNMPIQGSNADITKLAMSRVVRRLDAEGLDAFLINVVHDELVLESSEADAEAVKAIVVHEMMAAGGELLKHVPMRVDAQLGRAWSR